MIFLSISILHQVFYQGYVFVNQLFVGFVSSGHVTAHQKWRIDSHGYQRFCGFNHQQVDGKHIAKGRGWSHFFNGSLEIHNGIPIGQVVV